MTERVWWSEGVLQKHTPRDRFFDWTEDPSLNVWVGAFIRLSQNGQIAPKPPTQIPFARPLIGDGEMPDQLDDGSGRKLDLIFGWESKYVFTHEALDFMRSLNLPDARFYDNGDEVQFLEYNGQPITEPAALFLPGVLKDTVIKDQSPAFGKNVWGDFPNRVAASGQRRDGCIVVSKAALDGPPVWVEKLYYDTLFFSDAVKQKIDAAGLSEAFALRPVEVIL